MKDMPPVTQVTHKQVYEGPITRSHAKVLQKEVNSLLAEINYNIHENTILPKCSTLVVLRYTNKEDDVALRRTSTVKNGPSVHTSTVKMDQLKEIFINLDSLKLWRSMRTFWKAYQA
jgi:hypothetical protein